MREPDPFLLRAASFLRTAPEPGWDAISDKVRAAVHTAPLGGWPVQATRETGQGVIYVSDHVLRSLLARELRRKFVCQPTRIEFTLDATVLRAINIDVTGSYGTQLHELGDEIRQTVFEVIGQILDDPNATQSASGPIDVTITDVVDGDPLHP